MEAEFNQLVDFLRMPKNGNAKEFKNAREKVQAKVDVIRTCGGLAEEDGSSTTLIEHVRELSYPSHKCAGILLLSQQAECLPAKEKIHEGFLTEIQRLVCSRVNSSASSIEQKLSPHKEGNKYTTPKATEFLFFSKELTIALEKAVQLLCEKMKQPLLGLDIFMHGCEILRPREGCLTSADGMLLRLCIEGQNFDFAESILDSQIIFEIDPTESYLDPEHYLAYFNNGGIVYMAKRRFAKALEYFENAITVPSLVCSEISLSAFKKASFISLIHTGKLYTCPEHTDNAVRSKVRKNTKDYSKVADFYMKSDRKGLATFLLEDSIKKQFEDDGNYGLALHVLSVLQDKAMMDLTSTYIKLSIKDVASKIGAQSVEHAREDLEKLISSGRIKGTIDQSTGMVTFRSEGASAAEVDLPDLLERVEESVQLSHKLRDIKRDVLTSMEYFHSTTSRSSSVSFLGMPSFTSGSYASMDVDVDAGRDVEMET